MYRTGFRDASVASEVLSSLEWGSIHGSWVNISGVGHPTDSFISIY